ncbi:response regulator transcription factor [Scardovia inopinata]|uniref:response regulator transcription factor n=1 Tax=Scardovia inopinata TaxID=78259 RepID=UPI002158EC5C|nr:response regulator transcription factor [Scardovia inopinata]
MSLVWTTFLGRKAISLMRDPSTVPDALLIDMQLNDMTGVEVIHHIRQCNSSVGIVAMTSFPLKEYAHTAASYGAQGIVSKRNIHEIISALNIVSLGKPWENNDPMVDNSCFVTPQKAFAKLQVETLTARESQIMDAYCHGLSTQEIADKFAISINTVKTLAKRSFSKLGAHNRAQAVVLWVQKNKFHKILFYRSFCHPIGDLSSLPIKKPSRLVIASNSSIYWST